MTRHRPSSEDILSWPDGAWCFRFELSGMSHKSDDFQLIPDNTPEHEAFLVRES